jgi:hypothetical protein
MMDSLGDDLRYPPGHEFECAMINRELFDQEINKLATLYKTKLDPKGVERFYLSICKHLTAEQFLKSSRIMYYSGIPRPEGYFPCPMDFVDFVDLVY